MMTGMYRALGTGAERLAGWVDVLDRINVFPVADGDTGRNLYLTVAPLIQADSDQASMVRAVMFAARGNSGNIAAAFLSGLLKVEDTDGLKQGMHTGRALAWGAVADPKPGTMLSILDALCDALDHVSTLDDNTTGLLIERMKQAVLDTPKQLPVLKEAGVVDSGALGMFLFLEGFLNDLAGRRDGFVPVHEAFGDYLRLSGDWQGNGGADGECVNAVLEVGQDTQAQTVHDGLQSMGHSVVMTRQANRVKLHLHTTDPDEVNKKLRTLGNVLAFSTEPTESKGPDGDRPRPILHVMTDAAGSVTRDDAMKLGMTLLNSYVNIARQSIPETLADHQDLYEKMRRGVAASTAQASVFERRQHYEKVASLYGNALYLCVGSVYTGNFQTVMDWKSEHDPDDRLRVIDTGAASGRLGVIALATAEFSLKAKNATDVIAFAAHAVKHSREYIFLDRLVFLARGGRLSKTKAFFGDMLHKKPVVAPFADGVRKLAVLHDRKEQVKWAAEHLKQDLPEGPVMVMLEYTDNEQWVRTLAREVFTSIRSDIFVRVQPFSLTTGVHIGPGAWGLAFVGLGKGA